MKKIIGIATLCAVTLCSQSVCAKVSDADKEDLETYRLLALFGDVFDKVKEDYVEDVTDKKLIESALNGMLSSLDPHSSYLNQKSYEDMQVSTKGEFGGLGIELTMESGWVKVISPIDDTPAFKAGVKAGDYITHVDDVAVLGMTLNEAVEKMRGKAGTNIKLTIRREGLAEPLQLNLTRDIIKIKSVKFEAVKEDNVGYIRINSFSEKTSADTLNALKTINKELEGKQIGYILDLRNNPGGLLEQGIAVADMFLNSGEIVSTRSRNPEDTTRFVAKEGDEINGLPLVVLINSGSASASEIVSGALQDHHRAVIVGTRSFGKGSVQTILPITGYGAIRITTARYYTPSGVSIQSEGIVPDVVVHQSKVEQIDKAASFSESSFANALSNDSKKADKKEQKSDKEVKIVDKDKDYQLARAIDILKAISVYQQADIPSFVAKNKKVEAKAEVKTDTPAAAVKPATSSVNTDKAPAKDDKAKAAPAANKPANKPATAPATKKTAPAAKTPAKAKDKK